MIPDLPSPLLRSFVAVVDCGSLATAAVRVGRSESALSLQMSRLENIVGQPLFDRDGRALKVNQVGSHLLGHARAILRRIDAARAELGPAATPLIRVGVVQDFVVPVLRPTLIDLRATNPNTTFEIVIGSTAELLQAMGEDRIDTALCADDPGRGKAVTSFPMEWFGKPDLLAEEVLPLVSITPPCPFLKAAQQALDAIGWSWRIALVTPSLDGLRTAVEAGLGIASRTEVGIGLPPLSDGILPQLPSITYTVIERRRGKDGPGQAAVRMTAHLVSLAGTVE
ncbi:LysR family transcriptional regulator [Beijerinckia indica]|uniref:Transcriptional regulator, LysR family n=1 Tax=Beijerinckia indica subsp. indica (strain ATCC 9039 / DSM 1715 / NCIMB 8712) TaxID=395963 RepID=B2IL42_BEII9|nr:LysR family transcriptional regulator [Beijerinckia indica]ACB97242.1 transcriptional regulator, LysR family [Beijerinckia indica subsp. indica ATCC 9039]